MLDQISVRAYLNNIARARLECALVPLLTGLEVEAALFTCYLECALVSLLTALRWRQPI